MGVTRRDLANLSLMKVAPLPVSISVLHLFVTLFLVSLQVTDGTEIDEELIKLILNSKIFSGCKFGLSAKFLDCPLFGTESFFGPSVWARYSVSGTG